MGSLDHDKKIIFIEQFRARWPWSIGMFESWHSMSSTSSEVPASSILRIPSARSFVPGCGRHLQEWSLVCSLQPFLPINILVLFMLIFKSHFLQYLSMLFIIFFFFYNPIFVLENKHKCHKHPGPSDNHLLKRLFYATHPEGQILIAKEMNF